MNMNKDQITKRMIASNDPDTMLLGKLLEAGAIDLDESKLKRLVRIRKVEERGVK